MRCTCVPVTVGHMASFSNKLILAVQVVWGMWKVQSQAVRELVLSLLLMFALLMLDCDSMFSARKRSPLRPLLLALLLPV